VVAMLYLLSAGAALLMCVLNTFFRDFAHLTSVFLRAMFYLTPILYPPEMLGPDIEPFLKLNPAYYPIVLGRSVLYYGEVGSMSLWAIGLASALAVFGAGLLIFTSTQERFLYYA